jgi:hypothetical protein
VSTPLYIFDLDGTLADLHHRRHFVALQSKSRVTVDGRPGECFDPAGSGAAAGHIGVMLDGTNEPMYYDARSVKFKPNWDAFHAACVDDKPIWPVTTTLLKLWSNPFTEVWVWSGRMKTVRAQTISWLTGHVIDISLGNWDRCLKMRPAGDYTPDDQLKESWLHAMSPEDRARLVMTFDDRDRVVAMWRRNGVVCAQVAPGDI